MEGGLGAGSEDDPAAEQAFLQKWAELFEGPLFDELESYAEHDKNPGPADQPAPTLQPLCNSAGPSSLAPDTGVPGACGAHGAATSAPRPSLPPIRPQDRLLPKENVSRLMAQNAPPNYKTSNESKRLMQELASEFILYVTSESKDISFAAKERAISSKSLMRALTNLGARAPTRHLQHLQALAHTPRMVCSGTHATSPCAQISVISHLTRSWRLKQRRQNANGPRSRQVRHDAWTHHSST